MFPLCRTGNRFRRAKIIGLAASLLSLFLLPSHPVRVNAQVVGNVGGFDANTPLTIAGLTTGAHAASSALGTLQTLNVFRTTAVPAGIVNFLTMSSNGGMAVAMTAYVYDSKPVGTCSDAVAFAENATDIPRRAFAPLTITPATSQGATGTTGDTAVVRSIANHDSPPTTYVYVCFVANASITPASTTDLTFRFGISQD